MKGQRFLLGAQAWRAANTIACKSDTHLASGTADIGAICYHLQLLIRHPQRKVMSPLYAQMLLIVAFLRVHTAKQIRGRMPKICDQNPRLGYFVAHVQSVSQKGCTETEAPLHDWWEFLAVRPPAQRRKSQDRDDAERRTQKTKKTTAQLAYCG